MRTLHLVNPYQTGARPLQRALAAAGLLPPGSDDDQYGPATAAACEVAKWRLGYPASAIHHGREFAGDQLLGYLTGQHRLPREYQVRRRQRLGPSPNHDQAVRAAVVGAWGWLIDHGDRFSYAGAADPLVRPYPRFRGPIPARGTAIDGAGRVHTDCSGAVGLCCYRGGAPDPHAHHYDGLGNTGTLLANLDEVPLQMLELADVVVWRKGPSDTYGHHAAQVVELAPAYGQTVLGSFGSNPPRRIALAAETAAQRQFGAWDAVGLRLKTS